MDADLVEALIPQSEAAVSADGTLEIGFALCHGNASAVVKTNGVI